VGKAKRAHAAVMLEGSSPKGPRSVFHNNCTAGSNCAWASDRHNDREGRRLRHLCPPLRRVGWAKRSVPTRYGAAAAMAAKHARGAASCAWASDRHNDREGRRLRRLCPPYGGSAHAAAGRVGEPLQRRGKAKRAHAVVMLERSSPDLHPGRRSRRQHADTLYIG
jgi:hypothetical protein